MVDWTSFQTKTFFDLYAGGITYDKIAIATGKTVQEIRDKYKAEKRAGNLKGLSNKRMQAKCTDPIQPVIEVLVEDGLKIPRHRAGYAFGIVPQVSVRAGERV